MFNEIILSCGSEKILMSRGIDKHDLSTFLVFHFHVADHCSVKVDRTTAILLRNRLRFVLSRITLNLNLQQTHNMFNSSYLIRLN